MSRVKAVRMSLVSAVVVALLSSCAPQSRMGMVLDRNTGIQVGSAIEKNLVIDVAQFRDNKIKLRIRNVSGDEAFDLEPFRERLRRIYVNNGFQVVSGLDDYALLVDINVLYSGQFTKSLSQQFGFLGAAAGGLAGYATNQTGLSTGVGILAGATLGTIVGSYNQEDTYIVVSEITIGVKGERVVTKSKSITFGSSQSSTQTSSGFTSFQERVGTKIAVYAGSKGLQRRQIAGAVRERLSRVISQAF